MRGLCRGILLGLDEGRGDLDSTRGHDGCEDCNRGIHGWKQLWRLLDGGSAGDRDFGSHQHLHGHTKHMRISEQGVL